MQKAPHIHEFLNQNARYFFASRARNVFLFSRAWKLELECRIAVAFERENGTTVIKFFLGVTGTALTLLPGFRSTEDFQRMIEQDFRRMKFFSLNLPPLTL